MNCSNTSGELLSDRPWYLKMQRKVDLNTVNAPWILYITCLCCWYKPFRLGHNSYVCKFKINTCQNKIQRCFSSSHRYTKQMNSSVCWWRCNSPSSRVTSRLPCVHSWIQCWKTQHFCSTSEAVFVISFPLGSTIQYVWKSPCRSSSTVAYGTEFAGRYIRYWGITLSTWQHDFFISNSSSEAHMHMLLTLVHSQSIHWLLLQQQRFYSIPESCSEPCTPGDTKMYLIWLMRYTSRRTFFFPTM